MAHNVTVAATTTNAIADAVALLCDGGTIKVYDGTQPATAGTAVTTQTLLATCTFSNPAFSAAVAGVATAHAITQDASADANGTATWFRVLSSSGAKVFDGTVGVGSSFDCNVATTTVVAAAPFPIASMTITAGAADSGGGDTPTLTEVLIAGNDTGGLAIINVVGGPDDEADVGRSATANGDGNALANTTATANGDGNAEAQSTTTSVGQGNATSTSNATAADGTASVARSAQSATWLANANTGATGPFQAHANTTATTTDGNAEVKNHAVATGTGTAVAWVRATGANGGQITMIEVAATATGKSIKITGLPTSDPGVAGQLYSNGVPSAGVPKPLMVSGG